MTAAACHYEPGESPAELAEEVSDELGFVVRSFQALLPLLGSAPKDAAVNARALHALLHPMADIAGQAEDAARRLHALAGVAR